MLNKKMMAAFAAGATLLSSFAFAAPAMALTIGDLAAADFKAPSESTLNDLDKSIFLLDLLRTVLCLRFRLLR